MQHWVQWDVAVWGPGGGHGSRAASPGPAPQPGPLPITFCCFTTAGAACSPSPLAADLQLCQSRCVLFRAQNPPTASPDTPPPTTRMGQNLWGAGSVGCPSPEAAPTAPPRAGGSHTVTSPHGGAAVPPGVPQPPSAPAASHPPKARAVGMGSGGGRIRASVSPAVRWGGAHCRVSNSRTSHPLRMAAV